MAAGFHPRAREDVEFSLCQSLRRPPGAFDRIAVLGTISEARAFQAL